MSGKSGQTERQGATSKSPGITAATVLVSASFMLVPTAASAGYNISGLVRLALAHYNGGGYRPSGGHQVSRQRDADADDETDSDTPPRKTDVSVSSVPSRRPDTDRISSPTTESDRMASGRQYRDDPLDLTH